jgi:hypothetical protein
MVLVSSSWVGQLFKTSSLVRVELPLMTLLGLRIL